MTPSAAIANHRPKADGFPRAPLIEAILDVHFDKPLADDEMDRARTALEQYYPSFAVQAQHNLNFNIEANSVEVGTPQRHFRGTALDVSELVLLRPDGVGTSQLAPYRDWASLSNRFSRDLALVYEATGRRSFGRMAVRTINRIDIAPEGGVVRYENYLSVCPQIPPALDPLQDFNLQLLVPVSEIEASARIIVGSFPQAVEDKASFVVDIDVFRTERVPSEAAELADLFEQFRISKNSLYRTCLTERALKEFEE